MDLPPHPTATKHDFWGAQVAQAKAAFVYRKNSTQTFFPAKSNTVPSTPDLYIFSLLVPHPAVSETRCDTMLQSIAVCGPAFRCAKFLQLWARTKERPRMTTKCNKVNMSCLFHREMRKKYRWVLLNPNMDNPNSSLIQSPILITCRSLLKTLSEIHLIQRIFHLVFFELSGDVLAGQWKVFWSESCSRIILRSYWGIPLTKIGLFLALDNPGKPPHKILDLDSKTCWCSHARLIQIGALLALLSKFIHRDWNGKNVYQP